MSEPESPRHMSFTETEFRKELDEIITSHFSDGDFAIEQSDDLEKPADVVFAGRLILEGVAEPVHIEICETILKGDERAVFIDVGAQEYIIFDSDIVLDGEIEETSDYEELAIAQLRRWIKDTEWSPSYTQALFNE